MQIEASKGAKMNLTLIDGRNVTESVEPMIIEPSFPHVAGGNSEVALSAESADREHPGHHTQKESINRLLSRFLSGPNMVLELQNVTPALLEVARLECRLGIETIDSTTKLYKTPDTLTVFHDDTAPIVVATTVKNQTMLDNSQITPSDKTRQIRAVQKLIEEADANYRHFLMQNKKKHFYSVNPHLSSEALTILADFYNVSVNVDSTRTLLELFTRPESRIPEYCAVDRFMKEYVFDSVSSQDSKMNNEHAMDEKSTTEHDIQRFLIGHDLKSVEQQRFLKPWTKICVTCHKKGHAYCVPGTEMMQA